MNVFSEEDHKDIQGLVLFGYAHAKSAKYLLLEFTDVPKSKQWLSTIAEEITRKSKVFDKKREVFNIAFTYQGFQALGLPQKVLSQFDHEFIEGIDTPHRNRVLGDLGKNAPENWHWGGKHNASVHAVLCVFGKGDVELAENEQARKKELAEANIKVIHEMDAISLPDNKEHFGFRDGISEPVLEGTVKHKTNSNTDNVVKLGEFVLGFENEYNEVNSSPLVLPSEDEQDILPYRESYKDFGRNGSYMVFRQLKQNVQEFWKYMDEQSEGNEEMVKLATKMVGRWPSGAPLTKHPDADPYDNGQTTNDDSFGYRTSDADGHKCPIGSHLRRSNPRDALADTSNAQESTMLVNRHRILRRGRAYGQPSSETMLPEELKNNSPKEETGLHFICFNGNLATQFEFVQHTWLNRATFAGLYNCPDPLLGVLEPHPTMDPNIDNTFTVEGCPVSKRYKDIPQFVETVGGEYFFMPSIRAIKYLASLDE